MKNIKKSFSITLLSVVVLSTDERKENIYFGENIFPWNLFSFKNDWLVWYDSSMSVQKNGDKDKKKFFRKKVIISGSTKCQC